jgi:hypothetical protein
MSNVNFRTDTNYCFVRKQQYEKKKAILKCPQPTLNPGDPIIFRQQ